MRPTHILTAVDGSENAERGLSDLPGLVLGSVSHKVVQAMEDGAVLIAR